VNEELAIQFAPADTVTVYVPAPRLLRSWVVLPLDQEYVYVPVGEGVISIAPLGEVQAVSGVVFPTMVIMILLFGTVTLAVAVQPLDVEVTVTEYVPAKILERSSDVDPFDQMYV